MTPDRASLAQGPGGGSGTAEDARLEEQAAGKGEWRRWGPYVSDRAWGTVREDYSASGDAWKDMKAGFTGAWDEMKKGYEAAKGS
jgi:hypothetical protein